MTEIIHAIIIDDEPHNADLLRLTLESFPEVIIKKVCYSSKEGLKAIKEFNPKLIFLDIEMPVMNGFELLEIAPYDDFHVIFTTAHESYTLKAIKMSAVDYLLKPISKEELQRAITAYKKRIGNSQQNIDFLKTQLSDVKNNKVTRVSLPTSEGCIFVEINDILYFQAEDMYCYVYLKNSQKIFLNRTLKYIEDMLHDMNFFRTHKSFLINTTNINKFVKNDGGSVIMGDGTEIPIARSKKDEFVNFMHLG